MPSFDDFLLQPSTRTVLKDMGIMEPTPIQAEAIPALMAGSDLVGQSATGSGKTLAYSIPLVERLTRSKRVVQALVLVPTRELAVQVNSVLGKLAASRRLTTALLVGGRPYGSQMSALRYGSQIVVGTPGRIKDHLDRGSLVLNQVRICILDEADQMLDSGFAPAIEEILATTPDTRQMALFSATMPDWVATLQKKFLKDPVNVAIVPSDGVQSSIEQIAYQVPQDQKIAALCTLLRSAEGESSLIFGRTKFGVEKLGKQLSRLGFMVGTLHGDKSQRAREDVLMAFRRGQVHTLLATNVAARGLDIQGIYQVINYELPESSELFTHRIGRTGRMGKPGKAITLLVPADVSKWRRMARSLGQAAALQRLTIDEESLATTQMARPESLAVPMYQQNSEIQQFRNREPFAADQERGRPGRSRLAGPQERQQGGEIQQFRNREPFALDQERNRMARTRPDTRPRASFQKQQKEPTSGGSEPWQPEKFPSSESSYSGAGRENRRIASKQGDLEGASGKRKPHAFSATESQRPQNRRRPRQSSATRPKRAIASNRSASRSHFA